MKKYKDMTEAERIIYRISELREFSLRLFHAGAKAGLHQNKTKVQKLKIKRIKSVIE